MIEGYKLKKKREQRGINTEQVANLIGIEEGIIIKLEEGKISFEYIMDYFNPELICSLCNIYNITPAKLFKGEFTSRNNNEKEFYQQCMQEWKNRTNEKPTPINWYRKISGAVIGILAFILGGVALYNANPIQKEINEQINTINEDPSLEHKVVKQIIADKLSQEYGRTITSDCIEFHGHRGDKENFRVVADLINDGNLRRVISLDQAQELYNMGYNNPDLDHYVEVSWKDETGKTIRTYFTIYEGNVYETLEQLGKTDILATPSEKAHELFTIIEEIALPIYQAEDLGNSQNKNNLNKVIEEYLKEKGIDSINETISMADGEETNGVKVEEKKLVESIKAIVPGIRIDIPESQHTHKYEDRDI